MPIRWYEPGDEHRQASIYNAAAGSLPGFKPAKAEEISRRYQAADPDPRSRFYAVENGEVVGYAVFGENARISYPWCLPEAQAWSKPLLEAALAEMEKRKLSEAWAAYRADWSSVLRFLEGQGFVEKRAMINYVGELSALPRREDLPTNRRVERFRRGDLPKLLALAPRLFCDSDVQAIERFFWNHELYRFDDSLVALKDQKNGELLGVSVLVIDDRFAEPTKIDAAMPCFRLGAFGTECQRHKRVNGLFSCIFADEAEGELMMMLDSVWSRARESGLTHIAAQAPSDVPSICALYDRHLRRQATFPILARHVGD
jgi:hypothetical protein